MKKADVTFDPKRASALEVFSINFVRRLPAGDPIASALPVVVEVKKGPGPASSLILDGAATVSGTKVLQRVDAGAKDTVYLLTYTAVTASGARIPVVAELEVIA